MHFNNNALILFHWLRYEETGCGCMNSELFLQLFSNSKSILKLNFILKMGLGMELVVDKHEHLRDMLRNLRASGWC